MTDDETESSPNPLTLYREAPIERSHGEEMTMQEFGEWIENNLGTSVQKALEQAAFMLCCDVISQDIAKATLRLRERTGPSTSRIVEPESHPLAGMLALEPNRRHTWSEYVEMAVYWGCLTSNSLSVVLRDRVGDPIELIPVQTGRVRELVEGRDVFYDVTASTLQEQALLGAPSLRVPERDMIHVRGRMLDGMDGYSTMVAGKRTLDIGDAIEGYRDNLFSEDGALRGVFTRKDASPMGDEQFARFRQQLKILMNKFRRLSEPIVLEGDFDFEPISSKPAEVELTKQFTAQINATCRLLRVPPHKVFSMEGVKYENLETSEKMYVGDTLVPVCQRFEQRMSKVLLSRKDRLRYFFEFDRDEMTLRDSQRVTERAVRALERGGIDFDEFRAEIGMNPYPNGQGKFRMIPTNMTVIDENGNVVLAGSSTAKPDEEKPADEPKENAEAKAVHYLRVVGDEER